MEHFAIFYIIGFVATLSMVATAVIARKKKPSSEKRWVLTNFLALLIVGILTFIVSLFIGGSEGLGYGLMGLSIIGGTLFGGLICFSARPNKKNIQ